MERTQTCSFWMLPIGSILFISLEIIKILSSIKLLTVLLYRKSMAILKVFFGCKKLDFQNVSPKCQLIVQDVIYSEIHMSTTENQLFSIFNFCGNKLMFWHKFCYLAFQSLHSSVDWTEFSAFGGKKVIKPFDHCFVYFVK